MHSRFYHTWKPGVVGFMILAFLVPSGVLAQEKEPIQYKLFRTDELIKMTNPDPSQSLRLEILTDKHNAKLMAGTFVILPPTPRGSKVTFHYHKNQESMIMILDGEAMELIEGNAIPLKAGDVIFILPNVKHAIINNSDQDLKYMEFFTPPAPDSVEVK